MHEIYKNREALSKTRIKFVHMNVSQFYVGLHFMKFFVKIIRYLRKINFANIKVALFDLP